MNSSLLTRAFDADGRINFNRLRPYIDKDGQAKIAVNGRSFVTNAPAMLRYDEWKDIDRKVVEIATQRLVGIGSLISKGLTYSLGSVGLTISQWDRVSDMTGANISMSGITLGEKDKLNFEQANVAVPVVHKDFELNWRHLEASRRLGTALDTLHGQVAARVVAEASEDMLFGGASVQVDGATVYGYRTHPHRNTVSLTKQWTASNCTGPDILAMVQAMLTAARGDRMFGPFEIYIPQAYESRLDDDYNPGTSDTRTIRQRILMLSGISDIKVADRLTNHNVCMVQMSSETVDMAIAQDINTIQWDMQGGLQSLFKVLAVWVPRLKSDYDGQMGLVHMS